MLTLLFMFFMVGFLPFIIALSVMGLVLKMSFSILGWILKGGAVLVVLMMLLFFL